MLCMSVILKCYHVFRCVYELLLVTFLPYDTNNYMFILIKCFKFIKMHILYKCIFHVVALPILLVVGDVTIWYQSHSFDTEPGWAMLVVNETNISE
jgi:hypothetical protein